MAVYCPESTAAFEELAREIAVERGEPLVRDVTELGDGTVVFVAPPDEIRSEDVLPLQRRLVERGPDEGGFGTITGLTEDVARALYEDRTDDRDEHRILLRGETGYWFSPDDDCEVLIGDDVSVERFQGGHEEWCSMSVRAHGRPIHTYLSGGYLCGVPGSVDVGEYDPPHPYCVSDGERDCPLEGEIVPAADLSIPHVFLHSCSSMLPANDLGGLPVHLGLQLLDGADSLIAGYRQMDGISELPVLHYCLLRAGYTTAERCYLLNRAAHAYNAASFPYVPFGRPDRSIASPTADSYEYRWVDDDVLRFEDVSTHVVDVRLDRALPDDGLYVRNVTDEHADAPIYYAAFEEDGGCRLLLYTWGRMETEAIEFEVGPAKTGQRRHAIVHDGLANAERARTLGLLDKKTQGQLKDLRNRVEGMMDDDHAQRIGTNAYREIDDRLDAIVEQFDRIQGRLVDELDRRHGWYLSDDYTDDLQKTDVGADERCPYCDRPLFSKTFEDTAGRTARCRRTCPMCGLVSDVPVFESPPGPTPTITGEFPRLPPGARTFGIEFENPLDVPMRATYFPWLGTDDDEHRASDVFEPTEVTTTLAPGESNVEEFEIDVDGLADNEYWLSGYVVGNLAVYQGLRAVVVGDAVGHRRADILAE